MPFSAQRLFPLKHSVLWKLSFEHFSNCRLSTFLSNQHFLMFFPTEMRGPAYTLLCSRHPEMTCQLCRGISVEVFCTCYKPAGRGHTLVFRTVEYQLVIKCSVETRPKKACVSTLYLKWCLIISELQNVPWPRPANAHIDFVKETLPPPCQSSIATVAFV